MKLPKMTHRISLDGVQAHREHKTFQLETHQEATFTEQLLALTALPRDVLPPTAAVCIMCDNQETLCVTAFFGSACVPKEAGQCAAYLQTSGRPGCMMNKATLRSNVGLTLYAVQTAKDIAFSTITQHRDDRLTLLLCRVVQDKGIMKQDPFQGTEFFEDSHAMEIYERHRHQSSFIQKVQDKYPDVREAMQHVCPLALYTFDSDDTSFKLPRRARADFLVRSQVMRLITVIWPLIAEDAWTSGLKIYNQNVVDVRNAHRSSATLSLLCSFVVKTDAQRRAKAMRKEADLLASCRWLPFKLSD